MLEVSACVLWGKDCARRTWKAITANHTFTVQTAPTLLPHLLWGWWAGALKKTKSRDSSDRRGTAVMLAVPLAKTLS